MALLQYFETPLGPSLLSTPVSCQLWTIYGPSADGKCSNVLNANQSGSSCLAHRPGLAAVLTSS